jgi:hypothetical protein
MRLGYGGVDDNYLVEVKVKVKQFLYRCGQALRIP